MADISTVKAITDRLENGIIDLFESDKYAAYLQTMSRFHRYSTRNTLLIHLQNPNASRVAGYSAWKGKFNRQVKKGEKGIRIFAPMPFVVKEELEKLDPVTKQPIIGSDGLPIMEEYVKMQSARFKVVSVFDISQTEGEPLPELAETLTGDVARYELFMDALRAVSPLPISFEGLPPDIDGTCAFGEKISIRSGMSEIQTVSAVIHEITHAKLHEQRDAAPIMQGGDEQAPVRKDRRTEEVEAESVSFTVNQYYGVETGANSFGYIAEWSKGRELKELSASLDTIRKAAAELIDGIDERYHALAKERGIDLSADAAFSARTVIDLSPEQTGADIPEPSAGSLYAKYCNIIAEKAAEYAISSGTLLYNEAEARSSTDQIVNRVVDDLLLVPGGGEHYGLYKEYMDNPDFKARLEDYVFIKAYLAQVKTVAPTPETYATADVYGLIADYAKNAQTTNHIVGTNVLLPPVFVDGNFNRDGKRIRVTVEEPAGKYLLFSREEFDKKALYLLTASGLIDHTREYFRDEWNEETRTWNNYRPTEAELDEVLPQIAERFGKDMANPETWAKYQHAAVLNRIADCEAHNAPVRELRGQESEVRAAAAERERQEEKLQKEAQYDARIDEIATAIDCGKTISVGYNEYDYNGRNPVLDLFKLYGVNLPLRTKGWVNTGLAEITDSNYRYYKGKHKGDSTAFSGYLKKLRDAIRLTPIEQMRQRDNLGAKTEVKNKMEQELYEKLSEMFPDFMNRKYSYLRLESSGFEPLSLEWLFGDRISVMHTYELNGDLCYDPMIEYIANSSERTLSVAAFQQSIPPLYQYTGEDGIGRCVDGNGNTKIVKNLRTELNEFSMQWFQNIREQGFMPVRANLVIGGDDESRVTFDKDGNMIMPKAEKEYSIAFGFTAATENAPPHTDGASAPASVYEAAKKAIPEKPKPATLDRSLPDPLWTVAEMNEYGYTEPDMYPLSVGRAVELFDTGHPIYLLYPDNTEVLALDRDEIITFSSDGFCGITHADWERSPVRAAQMAVAANAHGRREAELLYGEGNRFGIYQIKDGIDGASDFRFASMKELEAHGLAVDSANYVLVYTAPFSQRIECLTGRYPVLNKIYEDFNINQPADYEARSVSVSDVIVLKSGGGISSHFVDSAGFKELTGFLGEGNYREAEKREAERFENDRIIDINVSSPPAPTVAELEADVKAGGTTSLADLSKAVNAERKPPVSKGKPSLLGRLEVANKQVEQNRHTQNAGIKKEMGHE